MKFNLAVRSTMARNITFLKCLKMPLKLLTYLWKTIKSRVFLRIVESLIIGLVSGFFVAYLLSGPKFSITNTTIHKNKGTDSIDVHITFQNIGDSMAEYVKIEHFAAVEDIAIAKIVKKPLERENVESGDRYDYSVRNLSHHNKYLYFWLKIEYSDTSSLRQFITTLFGRPYKKTRWTRYNPIKEKFETIPGDEVDKIAKYEKLVKQIEDRNFERINGKRVHIE